ncbi:MAG: nascent polypeptide-associated complex protein [Candidatus Odinarchaeia archaeon]
MPKKMSPKAMKKAMKRMGIDVKEVNGVTEVVIKCVDKEIIITNPQVTMITSAGQKSFQILGQIEERAISEGPSEEIKVDEELIIPEEDIKLVASQASVSLEEAEEALRAAGGNLAQAILNLKNM